MFRRTEQGTDETAARDENAYEDNWYRSLKALAEHRALEQDAEQDEPREGDEAPREAVAALTEELSALSAEHDAVVGELGPTEETDPLTGEKDGTSVQELEVQELEVQELEVQGLGVQELEVQELGVQELEVQELEVQELEVQELAPEEPPASPETDGQLGPPGSDNAAERATDVPGPIQVDEVEELSARADHLIGRFRALRYPTDDEVPAVEDRSGTEGEAEGSGGPEMSTRALQLLERLRTLRHLGEGVEPDGTNPA